MGATDEPRAGKLTDADLEVLREKGISAVDAARQMALLRRPPPPVRLVRPCTLGDGIRRVERREVPRLLAAQAEAAAAGRFTKLVPASGAATRMFRELERFRHGDAREGSWTDVVALAGRGDREATALTTVVQGLDRFAFHDDLRRALRARGLRLERLVQEGRFAPILDALLDDAGLGYGRLPKALVKFHRAGRTSRTPIEEHLVEAAAYARDARGVCRLHFTVSPEQREVVDRHVRQARRALGARLGVRFEVGLSIQSPSTDTIVADRRGRPVRDAHGCLLFHPSGHGALLPNLEALEADLVYLKNVDNVQPDGARAATVEWKRVLGGYLVLLERRCRELLARLGAPEAQSGALDDATRFAGARLGVELDGRLAGRSRAARRDWLVDRLSRPLRVCGMVRQTGEPGGGPFWVQGADGTLTNQIVELSQIDPDDPGQASIPTLGTHFNPVDLVCAVRDTDGRPWPLARFVDPEAVIVATKSLQGHEVRVLERPGLWNGAMAGWNTVFVEVPLATFTPVKSVLDLLRPEHQTG